MTTSTSQTPTRATCLHMEGVSGLGCDCEWQQLDDLAHEMANANEVELCWFLRGMNDRANGSEEEQVGVYRNYYNAGWDAVQPGDVISEGLARNLFNEKF
jgi:hypothetical protein